MIVKVSVPETGAKCGGYVLDDQGFARQDKKSQTLTG
jgi:hypothetical protein